MALNEDDPSGVQTLSASVAEIQELADQILELLQVRIRSGQIVVNFNEWRVQSVETRAHHRLRQPEAGCQANVSSSTPVAGSVGAAVRGKEELQAEVTSRRKRSSVDLNAVEH